MSQAVSTSVLKMALQRRNCLTPIYLVSVFTFKSLRDYSTFRSKIENSKIKISLVHI